MATPTTPSSTPKTPTYPDTLDTAMTHLSDRRATALLAGAAVQKTIDAALEALTVFGYIAGDVVSKGLTELNGVRHTLQAANADFTHTYDLIKTAHTADDSSDS